VILLQNTISIFNQILKGEHMAMDIYDSYINNIEDEGLRENLQKLQQDHKSHAMKLSTYIQDLGGAPQENRGFAGVMAQTMGITNTFFKQEPKEILTELYNGEDKGIAKVVELTEGKLDEKSKGLVEEILAKDHDHLKKLSNLIGQYS
jgi:bacterioferritin